MSLLNKALFANASTSILSGITLLLFKNQLTQLFGLGVNTALLILGIGLLVFAASIIVEIKKQRKAGIIIIIVQDLLWVIASVWLLLFKPFGLSNIAHTTIGIMAIIVLSFAILQYIGLLKTKQPTY